VASGPANSGLTGAPFGGGHAVVLGHGVSITYLPIPPELRGLVLSIFHFACDRAALRDLFPAMSGFISFTLKGTSYIGLPDRTWAYTHPVTLVTPTTQATPIGTKGPFHSAGAVLSPIGWASLTGLAANDHVGMLYDGAEALGRDWADYAQDLRRDYALGSTLPADFVQRLAGLIRSRARRIDSDHAGLIREVGAWLGTSLEPEVDDLFARSGYSERQVQRLVERYYGCAPKTLARMFRALRVFAMLHSPDVSDEQVAEVIDLYYDQSHLIREFKQFIGRTPRQLQRARMPVLNEVTSRRNYRGIWPGETVRPGN
jgi:AraC-like DNA-binding protein